MSVNTELWRMSAVELAEAIRSGQASSTEIIEAHLRRIEAVNQAVNAVTMVLDDGLPQVVQVIGPRYREDLCLGGGGGDRGQARRHHPHRSPVAERYRWIASQVTCRGWMRAMTRVSYRRCASGYTPP